MILYQASSLYCRLHALSSPTPWSYHHLLRNFIPQLYSLPVFFPLLRPDFKNSIPLALEGRFLSPYNITLLYFPSNVRLTIYACSPYPSSLTSVYTFLLILLRPLFSCFLSAAAAVDVAILGGFMDPCTLRTRFPYSYLLSSFFLPLMTTCCDVRVCVYV